MTGGFLSSTEAGGAAPDRRAPEHDAALTVSDLHSGYGRAEVLHSISLIIGRGELVAVVGANGAGKSTLLNTIVGLVRPTAGEVRLGTADGSSFDVAGLKAHEITRQGVALVPEGRQVLASMSVEENLELGGYTEDRADVEDRKADIFERFPVLADRRRQRAGLLSGGEQQMLAIGRAMMSRPQLMLLDEPSLGLAPILVQDVFDIIEGVRTDGTSILLVEQNTHAALSMADHGYVIASGRVVLSGTGGDLLGSDEIQDAYLGGSPQEIQP